MSDQGLVEPFLAQALRLGENRLPVRQRTDSPWHSVAQNKSSAKVVADHQSFIYHSISAYRLRRFRVRAAFFAARERLAALRLVAARLACRDKAFREAARRLSRFSAPRTARERVGDGLRRPLRPLAKSRLA
jgi:hypothetical protein